MKKIFKCVGSIALAVCIALGCFFIPKKLSKNQSFLGTSYETAGAYNFVSSSEFLSSNFLINSVPCKNSYFQSFGDSYSSLGLNNGFDTFDRFMFNIKLTSSPLSNGVDYFLYFKGESQGSYNQRDYTLASRFRYRYSNDTDGGISNVSFYGVQLGSVYGCMILSLDNYATNSIQNFDFQYVEIGCYTSYAYDIPDILDVNFNYIRYVNSQGAGFTIFIPQDGSLSTWNTTRWWEYRVYYLNANTQYNNNDYYKQGFYNGQQQGLSIGQTEGYNNGFNAGQTEGFNAGYVEGLNTGSNFTFNSLISSVIDVPVRTFTNLFDFDLLGVNLASFFYALLTMCVVIVILKLALGGK